MTTKPRPKREDGQMTADDVANMINDWGDWKANRPREYTKSTGPVVAMPFGPKVPVGVWMTPRFTVYLYRDIESAWRNLPMFHYLAIRRLYVDNDTAYQACRILGCSAQGLDKYKQAAFRGIAKWMNENKM